MVTNCKALTEAAEMIRGTNPCINTEESLSRAMGVVDCCRAEGREDLAVDLADKIAAFPLAKEGHVAIRLKVFRDGTQMPPILILGWNFAGAMVRWAGSGFKRCPKKQISERLAICQSCPHLVDNHCQLCGCACIETNQLMNKLALASEACPLGKWK